MAQLIPCPEQEHDPVLCGCGSRAEWLELLGRNEAGHVVAKAYCGKHLRIYPEPRLLVEGQDVGPVLVCGEG